MKNEAGTIPIGTTFSEWTVIGNPLPTISGSPGKLRYRTKHLCRCSCGQERMVFSENLTRSLSTTCGHARRQAFADLNKSHLAVAAMHKGSRAAARWLGMHNRCNVTTNQSYHLYGGRGISVCQRWTGHDGFRNFLIDMGEPPNRTTLGRIDNNAGYGPGNCRWETWAQQARNKRTNIFGWLDGEKMVATDIATRLGMSLSGIRKRIKRGMYAGETAKLIR